MGQSTLVILAVFIVVKTYHCEHVIIQQLVIIYEQSVEMMMMMVLHTHFESSAKNQKHQSNIVEITHLCIMHRVHTSINNFVNFFDLSSP
jgi:hypothetical protein